MAFFFQSIPKMPTRVRTERITVRTEGITVRTEEITVRTEEITVRTEEITVRTEEITVRTEEITVRTEEITVRTEEITVRTEGITVRTKEIKVCIPVQQKATMRKHDGCYLIEKNYCTTILSVFTPSLLCTFKIYTPFANLPEGIFMIWPAEAFDKRRL